MTDEIEPPPTMSGEAKLPATREDRLEFLRQSIALTEHNIRSYDTKAQISLAAFLLSMTPLWTIVNSVCAGFARRPEAVVIVFLFLGTILLYCFVLWPVRLLKEKLTSGLSAQNLFYIKDPFALGSAEYVRMLKKLSVEDELTAEAMKLAQLRAGKNRRFNLALSITFLFYGMFAVIYLLVRRAC